MLCELAKQLPTTSTIKYQVLLLRFSTKSLLLWSLFILCIFLNYVGLFVCAYNWQLFFLRL